MDFLTGSIYVLATSVQVFLSILLFLMFMRAILSWFVNPNSGIMLLLNTLTEPFVIPVRYLLAKFNILQNSPVDFSSIIAYLLIWLISMMLPTISL